VRSAPVPGMPPDAPPPDAVREQLGRILASPLFRSSRHYPNFLRHVVEQTLGGHSAGLKERSLGMEVFGRDPHYDTNADPVVRTSACEVRKRLAQYYHEPSRDAELRIELPPGSYVPEFHFPLRVMDPPQAVEPAIAEPAPLSLPMAPPAAAAALRRWSPRDRYLVAAVVASLATVILTAAAVASGVGRSPSAIERFWSPVWAGSDSVLVCLGVYHNPKDKDDPASDVNPTAEPSHRQVMWNDRVAFADALTMAKLSGLLQAHGKHYDIRSNDTMTLQDLTKRPGVLIGAFNNPWTLALSHQLRFAFEYEPSTGKPVIRDLQNGGKGPWRGDFQRPYSEVKEDYAVVSRYMDPQVGRMVVVVAGIGKDGTAAAGEFVTNPKYLETLAGSAPANWDRRNLQVVLSTEVLNGNSGPPKVLTSYFW